MMNQKVNELARKAVTAYANLVNDPGFGPLVGRVLKVPAMHDLKNTMHALHVEVGCDRCAAPASAPPPRAAQAGGEGADPNPATATNDPALYGVEIPPRTSNPHAVNAAGPPMTGWGALAWIRRQLAAAGITPGALGHVLPLIVADLLQHKDPAAIVADVIAALGLPPVM